MAALSAAMKRYLLLFLSMWAAVLIYVFSVHKEVSGKEEKKFKGPLVTIHQNVQQLLHSKPGTLPRDSPVSGASSLPGEQDCKRCEQPELGSGIRCCWEVRGEKVRAVFTDRPQPQWESFEVFPSPGVAGTKLPVSGVPLFGLTSQDAEGSFSCRLKAEQPQSSPNSLRLLMSCDSGIDAEFYAELTHKDAHYMRFGVKMSQSGPGWPQGGHSSLRLWSIPGLHDVQETRSVPEEEGETDEEYPEIKGLPLAVNKRFFVAVEHPMGVLQAKKKSGSQWQDISGEIKHLKSLAKPSDEAPWHYGFVFGTFDEESQARRSFLSYLHRERPGRRSPMVHYNSWYDFYSYQDEGFNGGFKDPNPDPALIATLRPDKMDEGGCLSRIEEFGRELVEKRNTKLDSFLWDDGWDDPHTLWEFDKERFPHRFDAVATKAKSFGAGTGVWLSPWGGYGFPQENRVKYGKEQGYETNYNRNIQAEAFSLAGKKYRQAFHETAMRFRREQGVNMFKFDGVAGDPTELAMEMEAMLRTIASLRNGKGKDDENDVWINLTTGTWPSPFFLFWADSIWRGGPDIPTRPQDWYGPISLEQRLRRRLPRTDRVGLDGLTGRQRWIRWRSLVVYILVVQRSYWFPISQLMIHGVIVASHGDALHWGLDKFEEIDFIQEVWSFVAMGLQLQELYVAPRHMTAKAWDILAEGLQWSRREAKVLRDSHWAFGSPMSYEVSCIASWDVEATRGFILFQNPTGAETPSQNFTLAEVLELPSRQKDLLLNVELVKGAFRTEEAKQQPAHRQSDLTDDSQKRERLPGWDCEASFIHPAGNNSQVISCRLPADRPVKITLKPTEVLVLAVKGSVEPVGLSRLNAML
eukprot:TRINITY_DN33323_c0_g1_i1.p1 TRINITY_DN33323_c0_g1~~TRINITY_DN33323_c0_g1_i1.p1  ORF type:complete len:876 (-),score=184.42 TRINITY_DN33323_c0_g1_i1:182-2764(-)